MVDAQRTGAFAALRSAPFRRYYWANSMASIGRALQMTVIGFIIFELTESNFLLGLFSFMQMAPSLVMAPVVGVIVDNVERRRILATVFTVQATGFFLLGMLEVSGLLTVAAIAAVVIVMGFAMTFNFPASAALVPNLVPRPALQSAIAANSMLMNVSRIAAPAAAGYIIAALGVATVLFAGTAAYLPAALIILSTPLLSAAYRQQRTGSARSLSAFFTDLRDVFGHIRERPMLRAALVNDIVPFGFGMAYIALLPAIALDTLDGDAGTLGLLHGLSGAGALGGTLLGALIAGRVARGRVIWTAMLGWGVALGLLAAGASYLIIVPALVLTGLFQTLYIVQNDTLVQVFTTDQFRGRVIAAQSMVNALRTLGFLIVGIVAEATTVSVAIGLHSAIVIGMAFATLLFRPAMRDLR